MVCDDFEINFWLCSQPVSLLELEKKRKVKCETAFHMNVVSEITLT